MDKVTLGRKLETAVNMCEEVKKRAIEQDEEFKKEMIKRNKASQSLGESFFVFHLKLLDELLKEIQEEVNND